MKISGQSQRFYNSCLRKRTVEKIKIRFLKTLGSTIPQLFPHLFFVCFFVVFCVCNCVSNPGDTSIRFTNLFTKCVVGIHLCSDELLEVRMSSKAGLHQRKIGTADHGDFRRTATIGGGAHSTSVGEGHRKSEVGGLKTPDD